MDDESHKELNQPFDAPWDRSLHVRLLERLTREGCRAVVFDILFSDPGRNPATDERLARAIRENGKVVLAADAVPVIELETGGDAKRLIYPFEPFKESAAAVGLDEVMPDSDLVIRRHFHGTSDDELPSLSWAAASLLTAEATRDGAQRFKSRWINYYGPPGSVPAPIPRVSFYAALDTNMVFSGFFSNKVAFVGAGLLTVFSGQRKDEYPTPYSRWGGEGGRFMAGVEVQATLFLNLLRGDWLTRASSPGLAERTGIVLLGLLIGFGLVQLRPSRAAPVALAGMLLITVTAYQIFLHAHFWFPWLILVVQIFTALLWSVVFNSVRLYVQNKLYEQSLALYLSPKLVRKFASNRDLLRPGAKKETLTILFSDIAGFTSISEGMDSDELARHMNIYFQTAVAECIHHTDGTIVKYIGDAIFAFWNAPDLQSDHAVRACEAALLFRDQPPQYMNGQQLVTRIGLHTGVANVGNFGSTARVDYTALGENINLASRMEGLNKYLGTDILITRETLEGCSHQIVSRLAGHFRLKGFEKLVEVYELVGLSAQAETTKAWRETFGQALGELQRKNFDAAEAGFRCTLEMHPNDGPAKFYLHQIAEFRIHPPDADWTGEIELKDK
jgi:adenylate cyclase